MLKVAVIGLGTIGKIHAEAWSRVSHVQLTGVSGQNVAKTERIARQFGTKPHFSLEQLLGETDFDVLDICLPTYLHKPFAVQAAEAGKHVICEKPLGLDISDAQAIIDACTRNNVRLFTAHDLRFSQEYMNARNYVRSGKLGRVGVTRMSRRSPFPQGWDNWFADPDRSGGLVLDLLIHDFDWLRWTFGEAIRVTAQRVSRFQGSQPLEYALVTLRMEDGSIAHVEGSWAHHEFESSFEIAGEKGLLTDNSGGSVPLAVHIRARESGEAPGVPVPDSFLEKNPYQRELEHFADCIANGTMPAITPHDALKAVEIARMALKSIETGQPVAIGGGGSR